MVCVFLRCQFQSVGLREHVQLFAHSFMGKSVFHQQSIGKNGCFLDVSADFPGKNQWKPFCWMFLQIFPAIHGFFASLDPASSAPSIPRLESLQIAWTAFAWRRRRALGGWEPLKSPAGPLGIQLFMLVKQELGMIYWGWFIGDNFNIILFIKFISSQFHHK